MKPSNKIPHVVVIDDDPVFASVMQRLGKHKGVQVTTCQNLGELACLAVAQVFDVAVVDLYLDGLKQSLRGTDAAGIFKRTPVVLVSRASHSKAEQLRSDWPEAIRTFVSKSEGPEAILEAALGESKVQRLRELAETEGDTYEPAT